MSEIQPAPTHTTRQGLEFNTWLVMFAVVAIPVMLSLGFWQLARAEEKTQALADDAMRESRDPVTLQQLHATDIETLDRTRVILSGHYIEGRDFLLDNRIHDRKVGYEVISSFRDDSGHTVLVNRGWIDAPSARDLLPRVDYIDGNRRLAADVRVAPVDRRNLEVLAESGWPKRIQAVDVAALSRLADDNYYPHLMLLAPDEPGAYIADWPVVNMSPDKHRAYATQWFMMAVALFLVTIFGGTNMMEWIRKRG